MLDLVKLAHFRNLISLSAADGKIEEHEHVALSKIAYEHGIPLERLQVMLSRADEYKYIIPQNTNEKEKQLDDMIRLALVDGDFSPAERELINTVSEKLGISQAALEKLIDAVVAETKE
jgi:uncharacterized tellurite resistance protein B-like protein